MNPFFQHLLIETVRRQRKGKSASPASRYEVAKAMYRFKVSATHFVKDTGLILLGIFSAAFGLKGFLLPNSFIDGGVTGISLLVTELTGISLPLLILLINIPFVLIGYKQIGKSFALKTVFAISGLALVLLVVHFPVVTSDKLLVSVFGGFFIGAGIGLAVRGGAVLDGTEVLAIYLSRGTGMTIGDVVLVFNVLIFGVAAYLLSVETALYSILAYLAASKTVDFIVEGFDEYTGVTIVSAHSESIRVMIIEQLRRGVTVYNGKRGFGKHGENLKHTDIIFTVITRLEIARLRTEVEKIDPNAFIVMNSIKDTKGGMIKRRPLHS